MRSELEIRHAAEQLDSVAEQMLEALAEAPTTAEARLPLLFQTGLSVGKMIALGWTLGKIPSGTLGSQFTPEDLVQEIEANPNFPYPANMPGETLD
jgi:hypothetical protein